MEQVFDNNIHRFKKLHIIALCFLAFQSIVLMVWLLLFVYSTVNNSTDYKWQSALGMLLVAVYLFIFWLINMQLIKKSPNGLSLKTIIIKLSFIAGLVIIPVIVLVGHALSQSFC